MLKYRKATFGAGVLSGYLVLTLIPAMSQTQATTGMGSPSQLVAAKTVQGIAPAHIQLEIGKSEIPRRAQLELTVEPVTVSPESYIVTVSLGGQHQQLGSFAFFPPPRKGESQTFFVDAEKLVDQMKSSNKSLLDLDVQLVPANRESALSNSSLRILGAKLIGG